MTKVFELVGAMSNCMTQCVLEPDLAKKESCLEDVKAKLQSIADDNLIENPADHDVIMTFLRTWSQVLNMPADHIQVYLESIQNAQSAQGHSLPENIKVELP